MQFNKQKDVTALKFEKEPGDIDLLPYPELKELTVCIIKKYSNQILLFFILLFL